MYDFDKLNQSYLKYRYEIAFEKGKKRLSYDELVKRINALYNSLANMGAEGSALVMTNDLFDGAVTAFALSKCGIGRVMINEKTPVAIIEKLVKKYSPSLVFVRDKQLERVKEAIGGECIKSVVTYGPAPQLMPSQFEFEDLIKLNDYTLVKEYKATNEIVFYDKVRGEKPDLSKLNERDGIFVDLPVFCRAGASLVSKILYEGRKLAIPDEITPKAIKKKKIKLVVTDKTRVKMYEKADCEIFETELNKKRAGDGFIDTDEIAAYLSSVSDAQVRVSYNGAVISVEVILPANHFVYIANEDESVLAVRAAAVDMLYPYDKKKLFTVKQTKA